MPVQMAECEKKAEEEEENRRCMEPLMTNDNPVGDCQCKSIRLYLLNSITEWVSRGVGDDFSFCQPASE